MDTLIEKTAYSGYECLGLDNGHLKLWVTVSCGPRIIGLKRAGTSNIMALLPEALYETPSGEEYRFRGGHRLWHAPEHPERTYVSDDNPVQFSQNNHGVRVCQPIEALTGIQKSIEIAMLYEEPLVSVNHVLSNHGTSSLELAPWAITQLKPGGIAILPQNGRDSGLLPNRQLALWPYTDVSSSHISWGNQTIIIRARMQSEKLKIGWPNTAGWLAYWLGGTVFVKYADYQPQMEYFDFGSSAECFCDVNCLELETLGPKAILEPGQSVSHQEQWLLLSSAQSDPDEFEIQAMVEQIESKIEKIRRYA